MKKYIQSSLALSAIILFVVTVISFLCFDYNENMKLILGIIFMSFLIMGIHHLTVFFLSEWLLMEIAVEYVCVEVVVLLGGVLLRWFFLSNWWMSLIYITPVFVIAYLLEIVHVKTEISVINDRLARRKENDNIKEGF